MGKEKKEIGKLIELLNEYEQEEGCWRLKYGKLHNKYYDEYDYKDEEIRLISKWYGFIKWLVENDKIDLLQLDNRIALSMSIEFNKVERVLMALSISDAPIEDLISYLR